MLQRPIVWTTGVQLGINGAWSRHEPAGVENSETGKSAAVARKLPRQSREQAVAGKRRVS